MDSRLNAFLERADAVLARLEPLLPAPREAVDWNHCLAARWQREGRSGFLLPLEVSLDMRLSDLIGVDKQREQLARNTQQFLDGLPANHALLWGSRGTGKSSMVRALLAQHAKAGLRLIEIERDHLFSGLSRERAIIPSRPFSGVRISWLMLARNAARAWAMPRAVIFAASSSSFDSVNR